MSDNEIVVLGYGPQPLDFFSKAEKICGKHAVFCTDTARMAGAVLAVGQSASLAKLRERLKAGAIEEIARMPGGSGLTSNQVEWLANGSRGLSSNTLFTMTTGVNAEDDDGHRYPRDPSDFGRCRRLIEQCPELRSCLPRVGAAGPEWAAIAERWDELCSVMDEETPEWRDGKGRATKTYALMNEIIEGAQQRKATQEEQA